MALNDSDRGWGRCFQQYLEPSKNSHELYVSKMETEQVRAAIQGLPVQFREIIELREYEELSYLEIASDITVPSEQ
jgi:RNA polymerase sigma-70 factor (ECF subfamily)